MKTTFHIFWLISLTVLLATMAATAQVVTNTGNYVTDVGTVHEAQQQALEQARRMLTEGEGVRDRSALETAIKEMDRAQSALEYAKKSPDKLPAAVAAEQAAYQALLKVAPREYRMTRSRNSQQSGGAGQASQRELSELDMKREENRYETENLAATPQSVQQRVQSQTADRLKELAQRQQDLNERLRDLQNALQAARTDEERADIQRQLKRLQDEQRQMLASVDEMRAQSAQSQQSDSQTKEQQQLEQTRTDMERAAQEMDRQSPSDALAAGTRAEERMQNLRDDLRKQSSSQFAEQMRQLRNQAHDLTKQEDDIARGLDQLNNGGHQALDNNAERQQIARQMDQQQTALTNLMAAMRTVTEQSETTEPLLSKQLYDTLRRADQAHTANLLQMGSDLTERGFLPQASQVERATRTNLTELVSGIERAADSVLGSQADALRYAQKELDDLTRQVERELAGTGTNAAGPGIGTNNDAGGSNRVARAGHSGNSGNGTTNLTTAANGNHGTNAASARSGSGESATAGNSRPGQSGNPSNSPGEAQNQNGRSSGKGDANSNGNQPAPGNAEHASGTPGEGQQPGQEQAPNGNNAANQANAENGNNPGNGSRQQGGQQGQQQGNQGNQGQRGNQQANNAQGQGSQAGGQAQGGGGNGENGGNGGNRLRQLAVQLGAEGGDGGPITGGSYLNWSGRLRDVEQAVDPEDLRNQLATVRERVSALRADFRQRGRKPDVDVIRQQIVMPMAQVRGWIQDELKRQEKSDSLVPLDRDPVPDHYVELVRKYYEKLGSAQ